MREGSVRNGSFTAARARNPFLKPPRELCPGGGRADAFAP